MALVRFHIPDLDCTSEIQALEQALAGLAGVRRLRFDLVGRGMTVVCDATGPTPEQILERIRPTGLRAEVSAGSTGPADHPEDRRRRWATIVSGVLFAAAGAAHLVWAGPDGPTPGAAILLYAGAILVGGAYIVPRAIRAARGWRADMNVLMTVAVIGAIALGEWPEAAAVTFLFCLAQWLDTWSVSRARRAVGALVKLAPVTACRVARADGRGGATPVPEERVPIEAVGVGDVVLIRPGEAVPLDGSVREGLSSVDQSPITGESVPVPKSPGAEVFAGSLNGEGALEVVTTREAADSTLARIALLVEEAQARRAPVERWVDRFARVYTPVVVGLAALIAVAPPLLFSVPWETSIYRALVLLVISCPCALVISTPVTLAAALTAAAHRGVLVKGAEHLEVASRVRSLALDKTGTLTYGEPEIVDLVTLADHSEREVLERASAIESSSEHPLARAILRRSRALGIEIPRAEGFRIEPGLGASASFQGRNFWVGGRKLLEQRGQGSPEVTTILDRFEQAGRTVVLVGNDHHVCGALAVADRVRAETVEALRAVRAEGIEHVVMLTGDHRATAEAIAGASGILEVLPDLLPEQKVSAVRDLVAQYGVVAMVGDGVNDAPALAQASLGIAMGGTGTDVALETADVVLMHDDLREVAWLIRHARRTFGVVRMNLALSLVVKLVFLALALPGLATLWMAIAADMGASLAVIGNGLRLLRDPGPRGGRAGA